VVFRLLVLIGVIVSCLRLGFVILNLYTIIVKPVYPKTHLFCIIPEITILFCDVIRKNAVATNQRFASIIRIRTTSGTYEERIVSTPCSGSTVINSLHLCVLPLKEVVREWWVVFACWISRLRSKWTGANSPTRKLVHIILATYCGLCWSGLDVGTPSVRAAHYAVRMRGWSCTHTRARARTPINTYT